MTPLEMTCVWARGGWPQGGWLGEDVCGAEPARVLVLGCVHEHLTPPGPTCARCMQDVLESIALGELLCTPCKRLGDVEVPVVILTDVPAAALQEEDAKLCRAQEQGNGCG